MTRYIIIGNGIAANAAAESIRKADKKSSILMFSREKVPFYYRPALPEYIADERNLDGITLHVNQWYVDNNIKLCLNTEVVKINKSSKTVITNRNETFPFDKLLLATGGYSFVPPITGADNAGVFSLRTIADADKIKEKSDSSKDLVLIGGGLLGLEAGNGLRKAGLKVTVIEFFPRLLPRQMDIDAAAILQKQMEDMGFAFFLGARTKEISSNNMKLSVNLETGERISTDLVLISSGVRPETKLAASIGLEIDKGVKTDDNMKTDIDDIYAAGDLIQHRGQFYGIWPASMEQGIIAGANMAGIDEKYNGTVPSNKLKVAGIDLMSAGDIDADGKLESIVFSDLENRTYRKIVLKKNTIAGIILFGDLRGSDEITKAMQANKDISLLKDDLYKEHFDFSRLNTNE